MNAKATGSKDILLSPFLNKVVLMGIGKKCTHPANIMMFYKRWYNVTNIACDNNNFVDTTVVVQQ